MRPFLLLFFLFSSICSLKAQEVTVLDEDNGAPIFNVAIFNSEKTKSTLTDFDGRADISVFSEHEKLIFSHVAYLQGSFSKLKIIQNNLQVFLKPNPNQLGEIILSVSKFQQQREKVPQKVIGISAAEAKFFNPQTSADMLESTGQVYVQKSQLGGGSPMIRGFSTNRLLITVDGVRMNNAIFRGGNLQNVISIDPLALERTEVVLGAGPVVYGSDAVGGVMNFFTLEPKFSKNEKFYLLGNAYSRYATANQEKTFHTDFNLGWQNFASITSISFSDFSDLRMGSHGPDEYLRHDYVMQQNEQDVVVANENPKVQKLTAYDQLSVLQKFAYKPNEAWNLNLAAYYSTTSDIPRYDRLIQIRNGQYRSAEWYYGPQQWLFTNFEVGQEANSLLYDRLKINFAYQFFKESRNNRGFGQDLLFSNTEKVDAYSTNLDFEKGIYTHKLRYGLEYLNNKVHSYGEAMNVFTGVGEEAASRYPNGSNWQSMAAYLSDQWEINNKLSLQGGARYSHVKIKAGFDDHFYDFPFEEANTSMGALTGNLGLSWRPNNFLNWKINLASAFRAPNIDDIGKVFDSEPGAVVVPNPDLKPEHAYNAEVGVRLNFEDVLNVDLAGFYTILENALVRRDYQINGESSIIYQGEISNVQAIQNAASAYAYGFEVGAQLVFSENLSLTTQIALTKGKEEQVDGTKAALRHAAPLFGNTHLIWRNQKLKFDFYADYNDQFNYNELAPSEQAKPHLYATDENGNPYAPSWYTLNLAAQYEVGKRWLITAALENITDQRYRTYSSGIAAPGRNFILSVNFGF